MHSLTLDAAGFWKGQSVLKGAAPEAVFFRGTPTMILVGWVRQERANEPLTHQAPGAHSVFSGGVVTVTVYTALSATDAPEAAEAWYHTHSYRMRFSSTARSGTFSSG